MKEKKELITIKILDLEIDEKVYKRILIIGIVLIICYCMISFLSLAIPRIYIMDKDTMIAEDGEVVTSIDMLYRGSLRLELSGWAYKKDESVDTFESYFILKSQDSGRMFILQTERREVPDLLTVDGKYNCKYSGLHAKSIILGLKDGNYDLYILYKNNNENLMVDTGIVVSL